MLEQLLKDRYSVRDYASTPIEKEILDKILEAGRVAPSARNCQPLKVYVLQSAEALEKAKQTSPCTFNAPVVLMMCSDSNLGYQNPFTEEKYNTMDVTIATTQMMLQATELGVGSCWVCRFNPPLAKEVFNLPENIHPKCLLTLGYPSDTATPSDRHFSRKPMEEMVTYL